MRLFEKDSSSASILLNWWSNLSDHSGDRAALRRATSVVDAVQVPYVHYLLSALKEEHPYGDKIAAICGILSHIRADNPAVSFAIQMAGPRPGSEQSVISNLRFRRLLQYREITRDSLFYQSVIRIIKNLDSRVNIRDLAESLYYWGDYTVKRWAYEYYGTSFSENTDNKED